MQKDLPLIRITKKKFFIALGAVSLLGFLLRIGVSTELVHTYAPVTKPSHLTDMYTYQELSREVLEGTYDIAGGFYYQPFYYTVFLPLVYKIGGFTHWSVIVAQSLLGLGTIWVSGIAFARIFGKTTGLITAFLTATNRYLIFYTPFTLIATLQTFWISLLFWGCVVILKYKKYWMCLGLGIVHGVAVATRGNVILLALVVVALLIHSFRSSTKSICYAGLIYLLGLTLPQLPYSFINYRAHHKWIGASTAGSSVLALGNTPESPPGGREEHYGAGPMEYPDSYYDWIEQDKSKAENRVSVLFQISRWFRSEPLAYLELKFRMLLLFWNQAEVPNNVALKALLSKVKAPLLNAPFLFDFLVIGSLGLAGMIFSILFRKKNPLTLVGISFVCVYCLSIVLFYILARFRLPIFPLLCGFSGFAVVSIIKYGRLYVSERKHRKPFLYSIAISLGMFLIVGFGFDIYRGFWEKHIIQLVRPNGVQLVLGSKIIIKDHGPITFGGWNAELMLGVQKVTKNFIVKHGQEFQTIMIRFPVFSPERTSFNLEIHCSDSPEAKEGGKIIVNPGFQWVEQSISFTDCSRKKDGRVQLSLTFQTQSDKLNLYFDSQRFYNRTEINGAVDSGVGEMVVELVSKSLLE